ncbi:unnamed protein product [Durusdinium trenchii]|uniref:Alpha-ketoglutarate-dependent xanthine dioxygenase xan1 n=2 Tax=Durusdinium trenchii TaxID=1381693 RepID=A0ABP0HNF8_9DINO
MSRSRSPPKDMRGRWKDKISQLHPFLGARVEGVDLAEVTKEEILSTFAPLLEEYGILLFPKQQDLSPQVFLNFMKSFPDVDLEELARAKNPFAQGDPSCLPELPTVRALGNLTSDVALHRGATPELNQMGTEWHTDGCGITGLFAAQVPGGGEVKRTTIWANGYHAWEILDDQMKQKALEMKLHFGPKHTMEASVAEIYRRGGRMSPNGLKLMELVAKEQLTAEELRRREEQTNPRRYLPFHGSPVRRHPFTKRHTLWTMPVFLESGEGMTVEEARDSLEQVLLPGTSRLAAYVHEWSPGDFVLWDNRSTLHSATEVTDAPQLMYQAFLRTKTPMGPAGEDM